MNLKQKHNLQLLQIPLKTHKNWKHQEISILLLIMKSK